GAQRFELAGVDRLCGEHVADLAAGVLVLLPHRRKIVRHLLQDAGDLLLLLAARIDRPAEAVDDALDPSRREELAAEAAQAALMPAARAFAATEPTARSVAVAAEPTTPAVIVARPAGTVEPLAPVPARPVVGPAAVVALRQGGRPDPDDDAGQDQRAADQETAKSVRWARRGGRRRRWCLDG